MVLVEQRTGSTQAGGAGSLQAPPCSAWDFPGTLSLVGFAGDAARTQVLGWRLEARSFDRGA